MQSFDLDNNQNDPILLEDNGAIAQMGEHLTGSQAPIERKSPSPNQDQTLSGSPHRSQPRSPDTPTGRAVLDRERQLQNVVAA